MDKVTLREALKCRRSTFVGAAKVLADTRINEKLIKVIDQRKPASVHCYLPLEAEVDIRKTIHYCLEQGVQVVTSETLANGLLKHWIFKGFSELQPGRFNTFFPENSVAFQGELDMILVPGLGFSRKNERLGFGGGYYDRFLAEYNRAYKIGVCYAFQVQAQIPTDKHDIKMDVVISG